MEKIKVSLNIDKKAYEQLMDQYKTLLENSVNFIPFDNFEDWLASLLEAASDQKINVEQLKEFEKLLNKMMEHGIDTAAGLEGFIKEAKEVQKQEEEEKAPKKRNTYIN